MTKEVRKLIELNPQTKTPHRELLLIKQTKSYKWYKDPINGRVLRVKQY